MSDSFVKILMIAAGVAAAFVLVRYWVRISTFLQEVIAELKKVNWTSRKDLINSSFIVIISAVCLGCFITLTDLLLSRGLNTLIR
jgi:preprotein translocase SecE subunit